MLNALFALLIVAIVTGFVIWAIGEIPMEPHFQRLARVLAVVIALVLVILIARPIIEAAI